MSMSGTIKPLKSLDFLERKRLGCHVESLKSSVHEVMDNALNGKETSNYELEFQTKGKKIRNLLVNATSRRDAEGNVVGVVGVAQDVTEAAQHDR
jgi:PAS domain S-box-containing protein